MRTLLILLLFSLVGTAPERLLAQVDTYTFVTDRKFIDPTDLLGWQFRPEELEIPEERKQRILPGDYRFGITQSNLYVEGDEIAGVYSINNMTPTEYGYILNLMNARNPTMQGHLKVILNKNRQADAVVFKRSPRDKEIVFWLPLLSEKEFQVEKDYFTDRRELFLPEIDSLWGQGIYPFLLIDRVGGKQQRLTMDDSTYLHFSREIAHTIKDKKKRKKGEVTLVDSLELTVEDLLADSLLMAEAGVTVESRIADFLRFKTRLVFDDGGTKWVDQQFEVRKVQERTDRKAQDGGEKYLWEIELKNGDRVNLYLDTYRFVSSIEWGDRLYLMRGF
jgi:hypothetical protein